MSTVYLLRHGALTGNFGKSNYLGRHDVALSKEGRAQMAAAGEFFATTGVITLLASPAGRCLESAAIIGKILGLVYQQDSGLQEINLGDWDGRTRAEIKRRFPDEYKARGRDIIHFRPPGGESFQDLQDRTWTPFLSAIKKHRHPMAILAHAGVNRVILCKLLNRSLDTLFEIQQDYGCINILDIEDDTITCRTLNFIPPPQSL